MGDRALGGGPSPNPPEQIQTRAHVLDRLAQAYFELAEGYLATEPPVFVDGA